MKQDIIFATLIILMAVSIFETAKVLAHTQTNVYKIVEKDLKFVK